MTHGLSERVRLLQRDYRLTRGLDLSVDDALAELDRIDNAKPIAREIRPLPPEPVVERFPCPKHLELAASLMAGWGYTAAQTSSSLTYLNREGTATCCLWIHPEHRDAIEATLPMSAAWQSSEWDEGHWTASTGREFDVDGFEIHPVTRELVTF